MEACMRSCIAPRAPCRIWPLDDPTPYYEWFWRNLSLNLGIAKTCYPEWSLEQLVENAAKLADKHFADTIYCFWHGRSHDVDGKCPCEGHPLGVHRCALSLD